MFCFEFIFLTFWINVTGNNKLGGQDFNQRLLQYLYENIYTTYGSLPSHKEEIHRLRQSVEAVKLNLTLHNSSWVRMPLTLPAPHSLGQGEKVQDDGTQEITPLGQDHHKDGHSEARKVHFEAEISRKLFEYLNEDLFQKILVPIERVLKEGHLEKDEVDEIVLVGGSTRIPRIRQVIRDFFDKEPNTSVDPDLAVVIGVAIQAGIMGGSWPLQVSAIEIPNRHLRKTNFN